MSEVDLKGCVRVSDILKRLFSYGDIDEEVLKAKGLIGTNVHQAIIQDCNDEFTTFESVRALAYFDSYKMMYKKSPIIRQIDRLYCFDHMITGECDGLLVGYGADRLIDWKCSANANEKMWNMQAHFYWYLLKQNGYSIADTMMWINLRHRKHTCKESGNVTYTPEAPVVYEFKFDEKVLSQCLDEAI